MRAPKHPFLSGSLIGLAYGLALGVCALAASCTITIKSAPAQEHSPPQDTNPPDIQQWFRDLTNYMNGSCCGEGDGYPAVLDKIPMRPGEVGHGVIIDGSSKDIIAHGRVLKSRPEITGSKEFTFDFEQRTLEKYGNPFGHAFVFVHVENGQITSTMAFPNGIYCVVILAPGV